MSAGWLAYVLAVGTVLALAAVLLEAGLRLRYLPTRWVWAGALLGTIVLATAAPLRHVPPAAPLTVVMEAAVVEGGTLAVSSSGSTAGFGPIGLAREVSGAALRRASESIGALGMDGAKPWLLAGWLIVSGSMAIGLAVIGARVLRARRGWPAIAMEGEAVRLSPSLGPLVVGVVRPEIVLPRWFLEADRREQRLILAHEREHVRARDPLLLTLGWLLVVVLPWHPAVWWMLARLRLAVELDCDRRVLRAGADSATYGGVLLGVAERRMEPLLGSAALLDRRSHLERRMSMLLRRSKRTPLAPSLGLAAVAGGLVFAACTADMPTAAEIEAMDVAALEERVQALGFDGAGAPVRYFIDGEEVTAETARALQPDQIVSVAVRRAGPGATASAIMIHTEEVEHLAVPDGLRPQPGEGRQQVRIVRRSGDVEPGTTFGEPPVAARTGESGERIVFRVDGPGEEPLFLLVQEDGERRITRADLARISPDRIESVEVLKDRSATARYEEPEARNGVVRIRLRSGSAGPADERAGSEPGAEPVRVRAVGYGPPSAQRGEPTIFRTEAVGYIQRPR